jgi:hypothetical protein
MEKKIELNVEESEILRFQINRCVINFYKEMLVMLEDLVEEHDVAFNKLESNLPPEYKNYVYLADYFTDEKFGNLRGKILSGGNKAIRELEDHLKNFEIKTKRG